jgi:hypothetical protein
MANLISDGNLIGYWPLNEASGSPMFHNWSVSYGPKPSGISFNLHVHTVGDSSTGTNSEQKNSFWPGTTSIGDLSAGQSGVVWKGLQLNGQADKVVNDEYSKVLILGAGGVSTRKSYLPPPAYPATGTLIGSGFTVGFWVNPRSNGYTSIPLISQHNRGLAQRHALVSREYNLVGFSAGVSGFLDNDYRYGSPDPNKQLKAFVHVFGSTTVGAAHLTCPVLASGYNHITISNEKESASTNYLLKIYKDGVLQNSTSYSASAAASLTSQSPSFSNAAFTLGGTNIDAFLTATTDPGGYLYEAAAGWGHLVSGVYFFNRVLSNSEVLDMHSAGGIGYEAGFSPRPTQSISINDSNILGYYPFTSPGYVDAGVNKNPLIADLNQGDNAEIFASPGPFGKGGVGIGNASATYGLASISGLTKAFGNTGSFTIAGWFSPVASTTNSLATNMLLSYGAVDSSYTPVVGQPTLGFILNTGIEGSSTNLRCRFFQNGIANNLIGVSGIDRSIYKFVAQHVCIMHDAETNGVAMYLNGELSQSGNITSQNQALNITSHLQKIGTSGYPLIVFNGIDDTGTAPALTQTFDVWNAGGGVGSTVHDLVVLNKTLNAEQIRGLCYNSINTSSLNLTVNDPRLVAYWACTEAEKNPFIIPDRARCFDKNPANLIAAASDLTWEKSLTSTQQSAFAKIDVFNQIRQTPSELASEIPLGITSGSWVVNGGSYGSEGNSLASTRSQHRLSSLPAIGQRLRPNTEPRSQHGLNPYEEYILSFEVTPSGNIPRSVLSSLGNITVARDFNSNLIEYCQDYSDGNDFRLQSFLTTLNDGDPVTLTPNTSGVSIVFIAGNNNATASTMTPLVSGNVAYGVPSRITFYLKPNAANKFASTGSEDIDVALWINGQLTHARTQNASTLRAGLDVAQTTADTSTIMIGGVPVRDNYEIVSNHETGLGEIYMRNIFVMKGNFTNSEIATLATSGIDLTTSVVGFTDQQTTTAVNVANSGLIGYWRFSGNESGTLDLSFGGHPYVPSSSKKNNLYHIARAVAELGGSGPWHTLSADNPAHNLEYVPAMHGNGSLQVKCSGITYDQNPFAAAFANIAVPPFIASGTQFKNLNQGFSVGFWYCQKELKPALNSVKYIMGWGMGPETATATGDVKASWSIVVDDANNIKMVLSKDGRMYLDAGSNAAKAGSVECGVFNTADFENNEIENYRSGGTYGPGNPSSWNHYAWTYNEESAICYFNGTKVDEKYVGPINVPVELANPNDLNGRLISFFMPQISPWQWRTTIADYDGILTDVFISSGIFKPEEIRYIAYNGIDDVPKIEVSGIFGGYTYGIDLGSGIIGSYLRGLDNLSGIFANYLMGVYEVSGILGGYIDGLNVNNLSGILSNYILGSQSISGILGSFAYGLDTASGVAAGYSLGLDSSSGIIGAFSIGGLQAKVEFDASFNVMAQGSKSFDSLAHVYKQTSTDFDALAYIYQDELPPFVKIIVPHKNVSGLAPIFNQHFVGFASGRQGKSINRTRWYFGDLTPAVVGTISGTTGTSTIQGYSYPLDYLYPVNHTYAQSGFFIAKFEAVDSDGIMSSDSVIINAASGIDPVYVTISGVPLAGYEDLTVNFSTKIERVPANVSIITQLVDFGDGKTSIINNPVHTYIEPGQFKPTIIIRDSRGIIWSDGIDAGIDYKESGGHNVW